MASSTDTQDSTFGNSSTEGQQSARSLEVPATQNPVAKKCVACRAVHTKCSGTQPCARCSDKALECIFVPSRKGKGIRKKPRTPKLPKQLPRPVWEGITLATRASVGPTAVDFNASPQGSPSTPTRDTQGPGPETPEAMLGLLPLPPERHIEVAGRPQTSHVERSFQPPVRKTDLAVATSAFFTYFAAAHPFLLPRSQLLELLRNVRLPYLEAAIQYVGSCYLPHVSTSLLEEPLSSTLLQPDAPKNGSVVQAMLLFAIGLKANDKTEKADEVLSRAVDLALSIEMHKRSFALFNGNGIPTVEESWRRTWWELYVMDAFFAGVSQRSTFRLIDVVTDVPLPCEEADYASGCIPVSKTLSEYDYTAFTNEESEFSSFAYRINAARNLGSVLSVTNVEVLDARIVDSVDSYLVKWALHLPASKRRFISRDGQLDHMLFQAHMIANASTIILHKPHSELDDLCPADNIITCAARPSSAPLHALQPHSLHTVKCVAASHEISKLVCLPAQLGMHTPFFTCAVAMSSVVHLAYLSFILPSGSALLDVSGGASSDSNGNSANGEVDEVKELIRLNVGALKGLAKQWPLAQTVLGQVKDVAAKMFRARADTGSCWDAAGAEDIMRLIEDGEVGS